MQTLPSGPHPKPARAWQGGVQMRVRSTGCSSGVQGAVRRTGSAKYCEVVAQFRAARVPNPTTSRTCGPRKAPMCQHGCTSAELAALTGFDIAVILGEATGQRQRRERVAGRSIVATGRGSARATTVGITAAVATFASAGTIDYFYARLGARWGLGDRRAVRRRRRRRRRRTAEQCGSHRRQRNGKLRWM